MFPIPLLVLSLLAQPIPAGRITGRVVEARTGVALAAVLVKVQATGQQALSDAEGRFDIDDVPAGPQTLLVSVVGYGLVWREVVVPTGDAVDVTIPVAEGASGYVEAVTVAAPAFREAESGVASQAVLGSRDLLALRGVMADDPVRAVQVLPGVATGDDFRAEFAVRGQGPRHVGIALDGIDSPLLFHTVRGVEDTGSLSLINSDILQSATLLSGAYPQRAGSHLGARLDFATREPARDRLTVRALVSGTAATTVWEGPLGSGTRGAWMVAARKSFIDWLLRKVDPSVDATFGFSDVQAKLTLDLSPRQVLEASFVGGRSILNEVDETPGLNSLDEGRNQTLMGNLRWRFAPTPTVTVTQQAYLVEGRYHNTVPDGRAREEGSDRDITWRGGAEFAFGGRHTTNGVRHFLEVGGQAQSLTAARVDRRFTTRGVTVNVDVQDSYAAGAAWLHYRWMPTPSVMVSPGARVDHFGLADTTEVSPWLLAEWWVVPSTRLRVGVGRQHQGPSFDQAANIGPNGVQGSSPKPLLPEEAVTVDLGIERRIGEAWRTSVTGYVRAEDHGLRFENSEFRVSGRLIVPPRNPVWVNTLTGTARGVEATVERRVTNGVSGWLSYAYGHATVDDELTGESYAADYDQTHMVNAYGIYRHSSTLGVSGRFRYASNFPIQGYYDQVGEIYSLGATKNTVRLPTYARLDLRADRAFTYRRSRLTLFVEVVNALNRRNMGPGDWSLSGATGGVNNLVEKMFPLLPSAGVLVEF